MTQLKDEIAKLEDENSSLKEENIKLKADLKAIQNKSKLTVFGGFRINKPSLLDRPNVTALASIKLENKSKNPENNVAVTKFSLEYLKKAINCMEALEQKDLDILLGQDMPVMFGKLDGNSFIGIVIAPRVENND